MLPNQISSIALNYLLSPHGLVVRDAKQEVPLFLILDTNGQVSFGLAYAVSVSGTTLLIIASLLMRMIPIDCLPTTTYIHLDTEISRDKAPLPYANF